MVISFFDGSNIVFALESKVKPNNSGVSCFYLHLEQIQEKLGDKLHTDSDL